ncbi:hypothetical protein B0T11DRAFT_21193 [Plectosphaerella cucumerina]|uniref:Vacuolar ATPase assembly integral membrane protein VMA21 n=1 Tax=Plectosphaerella cucumerina TaxID=40658 RepID=A0A8K0X925_9PEZI|nr:hypothetical protein B0T11DRAFT_21193 [Plectosphaerella cucumerina]
MATQRIISTEKTFLDQDDPSSPRAAKTEKSDIAPAVPTGVIMKLLGFTLAMVVLPIGSYFATVDLLFKGNSTFAGGFAAIMANVVLVAYVIVAMKEDQTEQHELKAKGEGKKDR